MTPLLKFCTSKKQQQKTDAKKKSLMLKAFKFLKANRRSDRDLISIPEAVSMVASSMQGVRMHCHSDMCKRQEVSRWCADTIHRHLCLMNMVCNGVITEARLQNVTVGLLYLLRNGIVVYDMVILPRLQVCAFLILVSFAQSHSMRHCYKQVLEKLLPLESHLGTFFGVRAKCITETENVIKIILRHITKQQLINAGAAQVACKL